MAHQQGQPSSSENQVQALTGELNNANKKVDRYVHLVASLSEELDDLRRSICHNCKKKFVPSYAPIASDGSDPLPTHWHPTVNSRQTQTPGHSSSLPHVLTAITEGPSIPICSTTLQQNPIILSRPPTSPNDDGIQSKQAAWSVSHNPNIKQSLQIELVNTFKFTASVFCLKFSPDGKYLAVGLDRRNGKTYIYDVEKGVKICCLIDPHLKNQPLVNCIRFSPDNKFIATASDKIRLWEIARKRTRVAFTGLCSESASRFLCFSPNGHFLVSGGWRHVRIWSLRDGSSKTLLDNASTTYSITFSPDGRHIASVDYGAWLRIWDTRTSQLLDTWDGNTQEGLYVAFTPDGKGLVTGGKDRSLRYWDVSSLANMGIGRGGVIGGRPGKRFQQIRKFDRHSSWIRTVSFSPDYQWVATGSHDKTVRIWDPHTAEWHCTLHVHAYPRTIDFSPAGKYLASGVKTNRFDSGNIGLFPRRSTCDTSWSLSSSEVLITLHCLSGGL